MDHRLAAAIFLDRIARKAAKIEKFYPSPKTKNRGEEPFNVSRLVQTVWPENRSGNNQEWVRLRERPEKLKLLDAINLSKAVKSDFVRDIASVLEEIEEQSSSEYAAAAENPEPYNDGDDNMGNASNG